MGGKFAKRIVLIGPDCSGKTALAEKLSKHYGIEVRGNRHIKDDLQAVKSVIDFTFYSVDNSIDEGFIQDQWQYPVDIVYNRVLREQSSIMEQVEPIILPVLLCRRVLFIHVDAWDDVLRQRYSIRGDELWDIDQILRVAQAYRDYFRYTPLHYRYLDTSEVTQHEAFLGAVQLIDDFYGEAE